MAKQSKRAIAQAQSIINLLNDHERGSLELSQLPFARCEWNVPKRTGYEIACDLGGLYAHAFAQYLKENRDIVGMNCLGHIASNIDFTNEKNKGFWVGFFSALEGYIHFAAKQIDTAQYAKQEAEKRGLL